MPDLKLTCDNCGSMFALTFEEEEVSYAPSHCPFCGDFYDNENEELDFNDKDTDYFDEDSLEDEDSDYLEDDYDDRRRH